MSDDYIEIVGIAAIKEKYGGQWLLREVLGFNIPGIHRIFLITPF